jgi:hypothetical protein
VKNTWVDIWSGHIQSSSAVVEEARKLRVARWAQQGLERRRGGGWRGREAG